MSTVAKLHQKIFQSGVGERTKTFLHGLSWSVAAALVARLISGITTIVAARWLGPIGFGEANLSLAVTSWIQVPFVLGVSTALMHYLPQSQDKEKPSWMADSIGLLTIFAALTLGFIYLFRTQVASWFTIPVRALNLALVWCAAFWIYNLLRMILNATENFRWRAKAEVAYSVLFPISVLFWFRHGFQGDAYLLGLATPYALIGLLGLVMLRPALVSAAPREERVKKLMTYGLIATSGSLASALFEAPGRLLTNRFLSLAEVGMLAAYQGGSTQMALFFQTAASQVFFPISSRTPDKLQLFKKLNRIVWFTLPIGFLFFGAVLLLYLMVLGKKYPIHMTEWIVFSVAAELAVVNGALSWFVASLGRRGVFIQSLIGVGAGLVNWIGCYLAIPVFKMTGAGLAYITASILGIVCLYTPPVQKWIRANGA